MVFWWVGGGDEVSGGGGCRGDARGSFVEVELVVVGMQVVVIVFKWLGLLWLKEHSYKTLTLQAHVTRILNGAHTTFQGSRSHFPGIITIISSCLLHPYTARFICLKYTPSLSIYTPNVHAFSTSVHAVFHWACIASFPLLSPFVFLH